MTNSKKSHEIVDQNDKNMTKSQKHDVNLQKNSTLYFQVGLILTLLATYGLFEMQFQTKHVTIPIVGIEDEPEYAMVYTVEEKTSPKDETVKPVKRKRFIEPPVAVPNDVNTIENKEPNFLVDAPVVDVPVAPTEVHVLEEPKEEVYTVLGVEQVPIYPGCEGLSTNQQRLDCMSEKLGKLVSKKFDMNAIEELNLSGIQRIYVNFKIDRTGRTVDIKARNPNKRLQEEAIAVVEKIPQMIPGRQSNKNVEVIYSLPIIVKIQD